MMEILMEIIKCLVFTMGYLSIIFFMILGVDWIWTRIKDVFKDGDKHE
jgi:hypothetical protein